MQALLQTKKNPSKKVSLSQFKKSFVQKVG